MILPHPLPPKFLRSSGIPENTKYLVPSLSCEPSSKALSRDYFKSSGLFKWIGAGWSSERPVNKLYQPCLIKNCKTTSFYREAPKGKPQFGRIHFK